MIDWITDTLGTASYYSIESLGDNTDVVLIDVREFTDKEGNATDLIKKKIQDTLKLLQQGKRVVVCCDKGISRSKAIALGALIATGTPYEKALDIISQKAGASDINLGLLHDIRSLFSEQKVQNQKSPTNILITGSTGFIGRALTRTLQSECELFCPGRKELPLVHDLPMLDLYVNQNKIGSIVHLAHPNLRNNVSAMAESIAMMKNILEVCRLNGVDLLYLSSLVVFSGYRSHSVIEADSSLSPWPKGTYAETKFLCEELIKLYQKSRQVNAIILRPAAVYGKGMNRSTFISKFFELAIKGKTIHTHEYDNGLPLFDFLYLDDLVEAILLALQRRPQITLNIGTGQATTTHALAEEIVQTVNSSSSVETIQIHDHTSKVIVNPTESESHLGWKPKINLKTGLKEIFDYYKVQHDF